MNIFLGTDHAGFSLKEHIKTHLESLGHKVEDCGADSFDENDDYPKYMHMVAKKMLTDKNSIGIIFGGSGFGEAMVLNRYKNIRAIVCTSNNIDLAKLGREHNNANVISIGARFVNEKEAEKLIDTFLNTKFTNEERHVRRIENIDL